MEKTLTIEEIISRKDEINARKNEIKEVYVPSLGENVKIKMATRVEVVQVQKMDLVDQDPYLIYSHMVEPNLADGDLQSTFNNGCEPFKIIDKIFSIEDVGKLSLACIGQEKQLNANEIKNS